MAVITVSRELGSEGSYIAEKLARALGYRLADKKAIENVLSQYGLIKFGEEYEVAPGFFGRHDAEKERMMQMLDRVIQAMAYHGNVVILGRGSFAALTGFLEVLNVRIQAPLQLRVKRVMKERKITEWDKAEALVKESDKVRSAFIQSWYGVRWDAADNYDLVIDTGKIAPDLAVSWLIAAHNALKENEEKTLPTADTLHLDTVLLEAVSNVLDKVHT